MPEWIRKRFKELRGHAGVRTHADPNDGDLGDLVIGRHARAREFGGDVAREALRLEEVIAMHGER